MNRCERLRAGGIYLLTPPDLCADELAVRIEPLLSARVDGLPLVGALQLRVKPAAAPTPSLGLALRALCAQHAVLFIVNDAVDQALELAADGVHLGRDDGDLAAARARLGPDLLIGASCYGDLERARAALAAGADYLAFGSVFPSGTKPTAGVIGLSRLAAARQASPAVLVAIGGITAVNAGATRRAGADWLAILGAVHEAAEPLAALTAIHAAWRVAGPPHL